MRAILCVMAVVFGMLAAIRPARAWPPPPPGRTPGGSSAVRGLALGAWRAWLDSPGGELPFGLELEILLPEGGVRATILNGEERIPLPEALREEAGEIVIAMAYYDSSIRAVSSEGGTRLDGQWRKRSGADRWSQLPFHARAGSQPRLYPAIEAPDPAAPAAEPPAAPSPPSGMNRPVEDAPLVPLWAVTFSSSEDSAVARFWTSPRGEQMATFLTTTGDYRFLAGSLEAGRLRLSCFDGAHAFLFHARLREDGTLAGDFWSRDSWHETWTARPDPDASLPDAFAATTWNASIPLSDLIFPDLDGKARALDDPEFAGRARILQLFGTWCPNCQDETRYLVELHDRYGPKGLSILGLAFEVTGDFERDAAQVRRHCQHLGVRYPVLVAGLADKAKASRAFPAIDRLRAFPTTIFLDGSGRVRAVHTGWSGPATGAAYDRLRERFETLVEELLAGR